MLRPAGAMMAAAMMLRWQGPRSRREEIWSWRPPFAAYGHRMGGMWAACGVVGFVADGGWLVQGGMGPPARRPRVGEIDHMWAFSLARSRRDGRGRARRAISARGPEPL